MRRRRRLYANSNRGKPGGARLGMGLGLAIGGVWCGDEGAYFAMLLIYNNK